MDTLRFATLVGLGSLLGCSSIASRDTAGGPPDVPVPPVAAARRDLACAPEELELAWLDEAAEQTYGGATLALDAGLGLLARGDGTFGGELRRARDGVSLGRTTSPQQSVDATWSRLAVVDPETQAVVVRDARSGETLATVPALEHADGWYGGVRARLTADGARVVILECLSAPATEEARAVVRSVAVADPSAEVRVELGQVCGLEWASPPRLLPLSTRAGAIVVGLRAPGPAFLEGGPALAPGLAYVDFGGATAREVLDPGLGEPAAVRGAPFTITQGGAVVAAVLSPDEAELALVGHDGLLRRLDAGSLAPVAEPLAVGLAVANPQTYLPSVESPVAQSATREWLAHVDNEGRVVLRDATDGRIAAVLETPFDAGAPSLEGDRSAPMALAFAPDGLLVAWSSAVARYTCGGRIAAPPAASSELAVELRGPTRLRAGERATFEVRVSGARGPVVRSVALAPAVAAGASLTPDVEVWPWQAGAFEVEAVVDDGASTATARASVLVEE